MTPLRRPADHTSPLTLRVLDTAVAIAAPPPIRAALRRSLADLEPAARPDRELALTPSDHGVVGESLAVLHEPTGRVHVRNPGAAAVWRQAVRPSTGGGAWSPAATTVDHLLRLGLLAPQQTS